MGNKTSKKSKKQKDTAGLKEENTIQPHSKGNNDKTTSDWLLVMGDFEVKLIKKCLLPELSKKVKKSYKLFTPDYKGINMAQRDVTNSNAAEGSWEYYRDLAAYSARTPQISFIPKMAYFVFAEFHQNTNTNNVIPESLRLSLLNNLSILSKDDSIKYDLRDANTGQYLYYKTMRFGMNLPDVVKMLEANEAWLSSVNDKIDFQVEISNQSLNLIVKLADDNTNMGDSDKKYKIEPQFDDNDCIIYNVKNGGDKERNTAFIHDMIDPNKNLFENRLWIPAIFDCEKEVDAGDVNFDVTDIIKSSIVGLDYVKYKGLYTDIAKLFKLAIQPMFENVLNYKLGKNEKIIVKSMKYVLQKPGDFYEGNVHREGMGENIIGIAIYYPQVSSKLDGMENGKLKLSIPDVCNSFLKCGAIEFEIEEGSVIVFSNQGYHQLPLMQYGHHIKTNGNAISRTILTFFIINQNNSKDVKASDDKLLCNIVNIEFYWRYYVLNMLRNNELMNNNKSSTSYEWMFGLVQLFLFEDNYKDYVWYKRYKMRHEKNKPLFRTILADNDSNLMCEESSYYPYDGEVEY